MNISVDREKLKHVKQRVAALKKCADEKEALEIQADCQLIKRTLEELINVDLLNNPAAVSTGNKCLVKTGLPLKHIKYFIHGWRLDQACSIDAKAVSRTVEEITGMKNVIYMDYEPGCCPDGGTSKVGISFGVHQS